MNPIIQVCLVMAIVLTLVAFSMAVFYFLEWSGALGAIKRMIKISVPARKKMKKYLILLALLLTPSLSWGGMAAKRMMAVMGQRSTGSSAFSGVYDGWISSDTGLLYLSSSAVHSAGSAILYPDFATNTQTLTQRIYSNGGYLTVWARTPSVSSAVSTITPYIDTVAQDTLNSNTPNTWQQFSIPITKGWHDVVFQFTRATTGTGDVYLDDIVVP